MAQNHSSTEVAGASAPHSVWFIAYLIITAIVSGALVMVIEVLGSRVIGPFFGVSLFVWTSLIAVTLIALAAGYAVGGHLADRRGTADWMYGIILIAGLVVLLVPLLKGPVLKATMPLGLRAGAFVSTLLLFGPSLFLLGCVSPYLVRIAAREMKSLGRTVGGFYALSTAGSVLGTVLTGFVLIAFLSVDRILQLTGVLLVALAAGYALLFRRSLRGIAGLVLAALLVGLSTLDRAPVTKLLPSGTRVTLVAGQDTFYGSLKIADYTYAERHTREMMIDGLIQGGMDMRSGLSIYPYAYLLHLVPIHLNPRGQTALVIGLGAGLIPRLYAAQGIRTDVVEIDPQVVNYARRYFAFRDTGELFVADARQFLASTSERYDYLVLDVFTGDVTPGHLLTHEAVRQMHARLNPGGVLAANVAGSLKRDTFMTASVIRTLASVFEQVEILPTFDPGQREAWGNIKIFAYDGPRRALPVSPAANYVIHPRARREVEASLTYRFAFPPSTPAIVLTDAYNPIDFHDVWLKEAVRHVVVNSTDWDVLIRTP